MGMGIVNDSEFDNEISNTIPISNEHKEHSTRIDILPSKGRGEGNLGVPESLRKIIGEESEVNGRKSALDLARTFGISPSSTSAYANGSTSTSSYDSPNKELNNHITEAKEKVSKRARTKLMLALNSLKEKMVDLKATDASSVAKDMSVIIKNMEPPKQEGQVVNGPQFVFYAPQFSKEESFDFIEIKE